MLKRRSATEEMLSHLFLKNYKRRAKLRAPLHGGSGIFSNASEFWGWTWSHGDRGVLESLAGSLSEFKRELFEEFGKRASVNGLEYRVFAAVTVGARQ
jgi:hypothetical protein